MRGTKRQSLDLQLSFVQDTSVHGTSTWWCLQILSNKLTMCDYSKRIRQKLLVPLPLPLLLLAIRTKLCHTYYVWLWSLLKKFRLKRVIHQFVWCIFFVCCRCYYFSCSFSHSLLWILCSRSLFLSFICIKTYWRELVCIVQPNFFHLLCLLLLVVTNLVTWPLKRQNERNVLRNLTTTRISP